MQEFTMKAPEGVSHSQILGTNYVPDADGHVKTNNPDHVKEMLLHGYKGVKVEGITIAAPIIPTNGVIDADELSKADLAAALSIRGVTVPKDADRAALNDLAAAYNDELNGTGAAKGFTGTETFADIEAMKYPQLKSYLKFRGESFMGTPNREQLLDMIKAKFFTAPAAPAPETVA